MTPQERELITTFLEQMQQTRAGQKDPEAEALIAAAVASQPDAAYLLVQRAVGLDYALQAAKADLVKVQAELEQARAAGGNSSAAFMGQGGSWGRSGKTAPVAPVAGAPAQAAFTPAFSSASVARPQAAAAAPAPAPAPAQGSAWGGMLGTVATTAAGVVAGSFLFQGIQGLMHQGDANRGDGNHNAMGSSDAGIPSPSLPPTQFAAADPVAGGDMLDSAAAEAGFDDGYSGGDSGDSA